MTLKRLNCFYSYQDEGLNVENLVTRPPILVLNTI